MPEPGREAFPVVGGERHEDVELVVEIRSFYHRCRRSVSSYDTE